MSARPRVLIADDHTAARAGVREALESQGFDVCAEASDGPSAIAGAVRERPDLCLLDVRMPGGGGIAAAREILAVVRATVVVMLTVSTHEEDLFEALRAGAAGYLLKETSPDRLPLALRDVLAGSTAIPRSLVARLVEELRAPGHRRLWTADGEAIELTDREWEVLDLMGQGLTTSGAARRLSISAVTVRRHLSEAMRKLRAADRDEALRLFVDLRGARAHSRYGAPAADGRAPGSRASRGRVA